MRLSLVATQNLVSAIFYLITFNFKFVLICWGVLGTVVRSRLPKYLGVGIFWWAHSYTPLNNSFDFFLNFYFEIFFDFFILFFDFFLNFF